MLDKFTGLLSSGGLPLLFLLVFLEGNPIIGSFIPGQVLVIITGFLISTLDLFNLYIAFLVIFIGAFLGDMFGYYLGKNYGVKGLEKFGLNGESAIYCSTCNFFKKFGPWSIILGREFNFTRSFMPFFAGIFNMRKSEFVFLALVSNLFWTGLSLALGYYFGFVVLDKLEFIFGFIMFLFIYLGLLFFVYSRFKKVYFQNYILIKKYALMNLIYMVFLILLFVGFLFFGEFKGYQLLNNFFSFFYFPNLSNLGLDILVSLKGVLIFTISLVTLLIFFPFCRPPKCKKIRALVIFIWGIVFTSFITLIFDFFINRGFGLHPYVSIIFLTIYIFFISILVNHYCISKKKIFIIDGILVLLLFFLILVKYSVTGNFYLTFLSFLVGALICEFLIILSHYNMIDSLLCVHNYKKNK